MTGRPPPPDLTVGVVCSLGLGPAAGGRERNEDNYLICLDGTARWREGDTEVAHDAPGDGVLLAVADGMGGHEDGARASACAVEAMAALSAADPEPSPELVLHRFVLATHRRLREAMARDGRVLGGTTLVCGWIVGARLAWIHIGDSRLYLFRDDALERLTIDHTRRTFAGRDRRRVPTDPDQLVQSFIFGSRGLGDDAGIRIDPGLDSGVLELRPGDRLLACTDGLYRFVEDEDLADTLRAVPEPAGDARALLARALAQGSDDNVTALVVRVDGIDGDPAQVGPLRLHSADTIVPW